MEEEIKVNKIKNSKVKRAVIILIVITLIIAIIGASYYYYTYLVKQEEKNIENISNKNKETLLEFNETIEYGSTITYNELLNKLLNLDKIEENTNIKILINEQEMLQDSTYKFEMIGNYNVKVLLSTNYDYTIITKKLEQ